MVIISEFGDALNVGGSAFLIESRLEKILVDCGMSYSDDDNIPLSEIFYNVDTDSYLDISSIDSVVFTHGHADHIGRALELDEAGYAGPYISTKVTHDIIEMQLRQSIGFGGSRFSKDHVKNMMSRFYGVNHGGVCYRADVHLGNKAKLRMYDAAHIPGSAQIYFEFPEEDSKVTLMTLYDLGRTDYQYFTRQPTRLPFVGFPDTDLPDADYVIIEATYGNRLHKDLNESIDLLAKVINDTYRKGGKLIIPAFSILRTQLLKSMIYDLYQQKRIPGPDKLRYFADSTSAFDLEKIMEKNTPKKEQNKIKDLFSWFKRVWKAPGSRKLWADNGPYVMISSSGMCSMGRVEGHLRHMLDDPNSTVLLTGYQAPGTRGYEIFDKARKRKETGKDYTIHFNEDAYGHYTEADVPLKARVERMHGLSGHADGPEIIDHMRKIRDPSQGQLFKGIFIKHGQAESCEAMRWLLIGAGYDPGTIHIMEKGRSYVLE